MGFICGINPRVQVIWTVVHQTYVFARLSMKKKKPRFVKSPEDHTPLPDPFPLPAHYREGVECCLKSGSMTQLRNFKGL